MHYRLVKKSDIRKLKQLVIETVNPYIINKKIKVTHGKKVIEIRPSVDWDKGALVSYLLKKWGQSTKDTAPIFLPIYIGDDKTDESAFKKLKKKGITVYVGSKNTTSNAEYYVRNVNEVFKFLRFLDSSCLYAFGADS